MVRTPSSRSSRSKREERIPAPIQRKSSPVTIIRPSIFLKPGRSLFKYWGQKVLKNMNYAMRISTNPMPIARKSRPNYGW